MKVCLVLSIAAIAAAGLLGGCIVDDSVPNSPRTENPWGQDPEALKRAEQRALEAPGRQVPTGTGVDAPRQLNKAPDMQERQVVTLQASGGSSAAPASTPPAANEGSGFSWSMIGNSHGRTNSYARDNYVGPLPHLPANPGSTPMVGSTPVPGTNWSVDHSWGQGLVLQDYPHRAWPESKAMYPSGDVKHNPVYYYNLQPYLNMQQPNGTYGGDWISNLIEVPWFVAQTVALPIMMVLEPPLAQRTSDRMGQDPTYNGHLAPTGTVLPTPTVGELRWTYPFLNPEGAVIERRDQPATLPSR